MRIIGRTMPALALAGVAVAAGNAGAPAPTALTGYSPAHAAQQLELEQRFAAALDAGAQREWVRGMSAEPNQVGSPHDRANAEFVLQQLRSWGWEARIETFEVLYPTPRRLELEMLAPRRFRAALREPPIPGDRSSAHARGSLPPYVAYGGDGDVRAELVYVNYGMPEDYEELARHGVTVAGRLVIARYGSGWRGLKPKLAQEHGAVGCIIYSDPRDDGFAVDDAYPAGGARPPAGVQRGSVVDMPIYPGDPQTPGTGSTPGAARLARGEARTLLRIPVLPVSWSDAQPLLAALGGDVVPPAWRGALALTYHFGPGAARVHLRVQSDWNQRTIYDVIGTLRGGELPDEWVIRGNHRDAWVFGAWDPLSGHAALLDEARAIGALARTGWRPKRTLVYASWDAEEPGLIGSTEWAEAHAAELAARAVAYVNSDTNERGFLDAGGSHTLQRLVNEVAAAVSDPETHASVQERLRARRRVVGYPKGATEEERRLARQAEQPGDLEIAALGSGSDYSPFLQHLGIASLNFGFQGEGEQRGVYHSLYDSYEHFERFGDPGYVYGVALAQVAGRTVLRLADADVPPFRYADLATTVARYVEELRKLADSLRRRSEEGNALGAADAWRLAADPRHTYVAPPPEDAVPSFDFTRLDGALADLRDSAARADAALARLTAAGGASDLAARVALGHELLTLEQSLLIDTGLPGRPWYRHALYAPGLQTGYGVKTLPGVREALEQRHWEEAARYIEVTAAALQRCSTQLARIAAAAQ
jgi:N-acetylated-alpha-linked acidic dipeptidase